MSGKDTRHAFRPSARRRLASTRCGVKPTLFASIALSLAVGTTPLLAQPTVKPKTPHWAKLTASPDLTIRYIYLVAEPRADAPTDVKKGKSAPSGFKEMNTVEGSGISLGPALEAYLKVLKAQGAEHYDFRVLAAGEATASKNGTYSINDGPQLDDPYQGVITDSIALTRIAPNAVEVNATGRFYWSENDSSQKSRARMSCGWKHVDGQSPQREFGKTYSPGGIIALPNGVRFIYAYCILPGKPAETATTAK